MQIHSEIHSGQHHLGHSAVRAEPPRQLNIIGVKLQTASGFSRERKGIKMRCTQLRVPEHWTPTATWRVLPSPCGTQRCSGCEVAEAGAPRKHSCHQI